MRILIFRPTPNMVNLNTYNLQEVGLAKALVRLGNQCDVAYYTNEKKDHYQKIPFDYNREMRILWLHGYGAFYEGFYPSLYKYIDDYDLIQIGDYIGIMSCWLNRSHQEKVVNYQGPYFCKYNKGDILKAKIWDRVLLPFSRKEKMIVGTKSILATDYIKSKGINNIMTLGVGLDVERLEACEYESNDFVETIVSGKNGRYLLYIGAIEPRRNTMFLLEVFSKILEKDPTFSLIIIGNGTEEYKNACQNYAKELHINEKIIYKEKLEQKHLKPLYLISDAFLLPTRYEIFGMVLLEAMYYGLPVFTTFNGGSSTLMDDNNGIIINNLDCEVWAKLIISTLDDKKRVEQISRNAKITIHENYTWDALAPKFIELYNKRLR